MQSGRIFHHLAPGGPCFSGPLTICVLDQHIACDAEDTSPWSGEARRPHLGQGVDARCTTGRVLCCAVNQEKKIEEVG